ncbi:PiggyBac transposable element-derived protein 4 [Plakobranchus ocellatus]|uniref:PiggyBac transposable element-derived protein 4 n=1 Tax=Plakobranchus ocellatus TaxID=259542 RepID=A0AAV3Z735_9GAST|nr:PiggyBac transposable element-derived protein 4 [Plakobranchus ocellatus]
MSLQKITPEQHNGVDEIIIPFKGSSQLKQYIRGKSYPWGIKLWRRAGAPVILYDFDVYQGSNTQKGPDSIGVGCDAVLRMASDIPSGMNYLVFADNFFTSLALMERLQQKGIKYIGTVRPNRLKGLDLKSEKQL